MVLSYILFSILALALAGYYVWNKWFNPEPYTLNSLLINNAATTFKALGAASTFVEVINLSLNDMQINGADPFQAFGRYGLFGVIEVLLTFFFISVVEDTMKKAAEDGVITTKEYIGIVFKSLPLFVFGFLATSQIHNFYLWSIYHIEIQQADPWVWFLPITGFRIITDPTMFELFDPAWRQPINPATVVLIYSTPAFNFILVFALRYKLLRDIKNGVYDQPAEEVDVEDVDDDDEDPVDDNQDDEDDNDDTDDNDFSKLKTSGLEGYVGSIKTWFNIPENEFKKWLSKYIGCDVETGEEIKDRITDQEVLDGTITPDELLEEVSERLIGRRRGNVIEGLSGIKKLTKEIGDSISSFNALKSKIAELQDNRNDSTGKEASNLTIEINKFKSDSRDLMGEIESALDERKALKDETRDLLINLNLNVPNFKEPFEKMVEKEIGL